MENSPELVLQTSSCQQLQQHPFVILRNHCTTPFKIIRNKHILQPYKHPHDNHKNKIKNNSPSEQNISSKEKASKIIKSSFHSKFVKKFKNSASFSQSSGKKTCSHFFSPKKKLQQMQLAENYCQNQKALMIGMMNNNRLVQSDYGDYYSGSSQGKISNVEMSQLSSPEYVNMMNSNFNPHLSKIPHYYSSTQEMSTTCKNNVKQDSSSSNINYNAGTSQSSSSPQQLMTSCNKLTLLDTNFQLECPSQQQQNQQSSQLYNNNSCTKKSMFSHYKDQQQPSLNNNIQNIQTTITDNSFSQKLNQYQQQQQQSILTQQSLDKMADQIQKLHLTQLSQASQSSPSQTSSTNQQQEIIQMPSISLFGKQQQQLQQLKEEQKKLPSHIEQQIMNLNMNNLQEILNYNQKIKEKQIQEEYIKKQLYLLQQQQMLEEKFMQEMQNQKIEQEISKQKLESLKEQQKIQQQLHLQMLIQQKQERVLQQQKQQFLQQKLMEQQQFSQQHQQQYQIIKIKEQQQQQLQIEQKTAQEIQMQFLQLMNINKAKGSPYTQEQLVFIFKNQVLQKQQQQTQQQQYNETNAASNINLQQMQQTQQMQVQISEEVAANNYNDPQIQQQQALVQTSQQNNISNNIQQQQHQLQYQQSFQQQFTPQKQQQQKYQMQQQFQHQHQQQNTQQFQQQQQQQKSQALQQEGNLDYIDFNYNSQQNGMLDDQEEMFNHNLTNPMTFNKNMEDEKFFNDQLINHHHNPHNSNNMNNLMKNNQNENLESGEQFDFERMLLLDSNKDDLMMQLKSPIKIDNQHNHLSQILNQNEAKIDQINLQLQLENLNDVDGGDGDLNDDLDNVAAAINNNYNIKSFEIQQQQQISNIHYNSFENIGDLELEINDDAYFMEKFNNIQHSYPHNHSKNPIKQTQNQQVNIQQQLDQTQGENETNMFRNEQIKQNIIQKMQQAIKTDPNFQFQIQQHKKQQQLQNYQNIQNNFF